MDTPSFAIAPSSRTAPRRPRERLLFFRQLFLAFALFALLGIALMRELTPIAAAGQQIDAVICAALVSAVWIAGYRRRALPLWTLGIEFLLLVGYTMGAREPVSSFTAYFIGVQYRALFGERRDAWILPFAYGFAFIFGVAASPAGLTAITPVLLVGIMSLGFSSYLLHTLKEVLEKDGERERALRESEQRFRLVAENLREALVMTDLSDRIIFTNARALDVFGYTPRELIGRKATELLLPEARADWAERMRRRLGGQCEVYETELVRKDGSRIAVEISASPSRDVDGAVTGSLGAISDITDRKRLEERLRQGMRMEAVGQLAGGVAHDFNNLLTAIKCNAELLLSELPPADSAAESAREIERSANRGAALTQQLLAFGRKQLLLPRRLSLAQAVGQAAPRLRASLRDGSTMVTLHDESAGLVFADPLQIEHVLATLVRNADEAMPSGGRIAVETRPVDLDDSHPAVTSREVPAGRYAMLSVSDTGVGMAPEVMTRLFEPFVTTKAVGEGTGLGLASVYGVVRQSGGHVEIESAPNIGTTVRVYLPIADPDSSSQTEQRKSA